MKAAVLFLALLAAIKVAWHEHTLRVLASEMIVVAYKDRAIAACQRNSKGIAASGPWAGAAEVRLVIASEGERLFWPLETVLTGGAPLNARLQLAAGEPDARIFCAYDIVQGSASVRRL
jgi:hypothetical protein